jgi:hypothetical protein
MVGLLLTLVLGMKTDYDGRTLWCKHIERGGLETVTSSFGLIYLRSMRKAKV